MPDVISHERIFGDVQFLKGQLVGITDDIAEIKSAVISISGTTTTISNRLQQLEVKQAAGDPDAEDRLRKLEIKDGQRDGAIAAVKDSKSGSLAWIAIGLALFGNILEAMVHYFHT